MLNVYQSQGNRKAGSAQKLEHYPKSQFAHLVCPSLACDARNGYSHSRKGRSMMASRVQILFILISFMGCGDRNHKPTLPPEKFEAIYAALLEDGGKIRLLGSDSTRQAHTDSILRSFGTTEEVFRSSVDAYKADPSKWKEFFEGVTRQLEEKQKSPQRRVPADSIRVTPG